MKQVLDNLLRIQDLELGTQSRSAKAGIEEARKLVAPEILQHFDKLRARDKKGIAYVRRGVCGQCHMQVAVGLLAQLHHQDTLQRCENCGAYLYLVEEQPAPVMEMPPRATQPGRRGRPRKTPAHVA
jgi:hypothetical protein